MGKIDMQILDSLIDGPLELANEREGNELIGMIVRYLRTGAEPSPRTDAQRMALAMCRPVLDKSRARIVAGSKGGSSAQSESTSKQASKTTSKPTSKAVGKTESNGASDIYSSSSIPLPDSSSEEGVQGEGDDPIPYAAIVEALNEAAGTSFRASSRKTRQLIAARWREGFRLDDFRSVIAKKCADWLGDAKMGRYLRPETLFGTKFEAYLNEPEPKRGGVDYAVYDR